MRQEIQKTEAIILSAELLRECVNNDRIDHGTIVLRRGVVLFSRGRSVWMRAVEA